MCNPFLSLFRGLIIRRLRKAYVGDQLINHVLESLRLRPLDQSDYSRYWPSIDPNSLGTL
jgi:hypothetical protein